MSKLFTGQQENVLMSVLQELAKEPRQQEGAYAVYKYLNTTPQTTLVAEIVEKLNEMGYSITANQPPQ